MRRAGVSPTRLLALVLLLFIVVPHSPVRAQSKESEHAAPQSIAGVHEAATHVGVVNLTEAAQQEALAPSWETPREPVAIEAPKVLPDDLPVAPGAEVSTELPGASVEETETFVPSPAPASSFLGSPDNLTSIPPDTHGAVGPNHIVVALNGSIRITTRNGSHISTIGLTQFWRNTPGINIVSRAFDPRVLYDHLANRWIIVSTSDSRAATSSVLVGVSQTTDPTGNWTLYQADADATDLLWADFPNVGYNKDWIVVQANMYASAAAGTFGGSQLFIFNKANLYAGGAGLFTRINVTGGGGTQVPSISFDAASSALYLVSNQSSTGGVLQIYNITGAVGAERLNVVAQAVATTNWSFQPPVEEFAPQLGSSRKILANDARIQSVVFRNNSLWCVQTVFLPGGGSATRSAVQWWELSTSGVVKQRGRIDDPSGNTFYAFPSLAVNRNNDVLIGYSRFSASHYASAAYSFRAGSDAPGTLREDTMLKAGEGPYDKDYGSGRNRWGDYSATVVDPTNDTDMWTLQEYAAAPTSDGSAWGVWWGRIASSGGLGSSQSTVQYGAGVYNATEGGNVQVTVTRAGDTSGTSTVNYATSDGTASDRSDYIAAFGTLRFAPGETSKTFSLSVTDDAFVEGPETVNLTLSTPAGAALGAPSSVVLHVADNDSVQPTSNPIDNPQFFVRQHYLDFFNREPDSSGLNFWANQIAECGANAQCSQLRRVNASAAFFLSIEFQQTGYFVYRLHQAAFNSGPRLRIRNFLPDTQEIGRGIAVGAAGWEQQLEANKQALVSSFVARQQFVDRYPQSLSAAQYVDALNTNTGNSLSQAERDDLVNRLSAGQLTRAQVLRAVAEDADFAQREFNRAFVLMQYFGYLRRNPDDAPDGNLDGFNFWLGKLNQFNGDFVKAEMVKAFTMSPEYRRRFGPQ